MTLGRSGSRWFRLLGAVAVGLLVLGFGSAASDATLVVEYGIAPSTTFTIQYTATGPTSIDLSGPSKVLTLNGASATAYGLVGQSGFLSGTYKFRVQTGSAIKLGSAPFMTYFGGTINLPTGVGAQRALSWFITGIPTFPTANLVRRTYRAYNTQPPISNSVWGPTTPLSLPV
jgi:hypothetical protein